MSVILFVGGRSHAHVHNDVMLNPLGDVYITVATETDLCCQVKQLTINLILIAASVVCRAGQITLFQLLLIESDLVEQ